MSGRMDSSGISTVVGLILVLGLIISVAAVIKIAYIPDVKKQLEADHMQHVIADFSSFKTQLDMDQAASAATGVGYAASASVEMGGGAIPGIDPSSSYGTLSLDPSYGQLTITAYDYMSGARMDLGSATAMGRLIYQSNNRFYANQNLSYECGMVLLSQPGGSIMLAPPSLTISADPDVEGRPIVSMNALRLNGTPQSFSSGGTGTIRTWLVPGSTAYASTNITNVTFTIISNYAPQWYDYLDGMLATSGLTTDNYALLRRDARTVELNVYGTGTQSTGLFLADSSFGTAMGYSSMPPAIAKPVPTPVPTLSAGFTASVTSGTAPLTVAFTDTSTGSPTSWQWSFGDGSPNMTTSGGTHVYSSTGIYTVTLTVTNATGSTSTMERTNYITASGAFHHLTVTSDKYNVRAGEWFNVTVTAYDSENNVVASYAGTISIASDSSPGQYYTERIYTFVPATNAGVHRFNDQHYDKTGSIHVTVTVAGITYSSPLITVT